MADKLAWDLKHKEGWRTKLVSWKNWNCFNSLIVGRFEGSFCKVPIIKSLRFCETFTPYGKEKTADLIFL